MYSSSEIHAQIIFTIMLHEILSPDLEVFWTNY